jgi:hypothetical protein
MTTLAAFVALALLWASQWAVVHITSDSTSTIEDAERAALATPLFWVGVTVIGAFWIGLWRWLRWSGIGVPIIITLVAASLGGVFLWRSQTVDQPVSVTTYHCAPGNNPFENGGNILDNCVPAPQASHLTLGSSGERAAYPPAETANAGTHFTGLPTGTYEGYMTSTAPIDTASILLAAERDDGIQPLRLFSLDDPFGGESRTWSTPLRFNPGTDSYLVLYYLSPAPALPDVRITFEVQQCASTSPTAFDPAGCRPMPVDTWVLQEVTSQTGPATIREPIRTRDGSTVTYTNLEERTYRFTPLIGNRAITTADYGFLVIPADGPQTAEASVLAISPESQQEEFSVNITPGSGTVAYTIYLFPTQNVYAGTPLNGPLAIARGGILTL